MIDTEDLERIKSLGLSWNQITANTTSNKTSYAQATYHYYDDNGKYRSKTRFLQKEIMQEYIFKADHINHNTLDNRKSNLRIVTQEDNLKHRSGKNSNNKSGYRNVCWDNDSERWIVQLQVSGKNTVVGRFTDVDEAGKFAENKRQEIYGVYAGCN